MREEERDILSLLNFDQKLTDQVPRHILSIPFVQMHCKDTPPNNRNKIITTITQMMTYSC